MAPMDQAREAVCVEDAFEAIHSRRARSGRPKGSSLRKRLEEKRGKSVAKAMRARFSNPGETTEAEVKAEAEAEAETTVRED